MVTISKIIDLIINFKIRCWVNLQLNLISSFQSLENKVCVTLIGFLIALYVMYSHVFVAFCSFCAATN